MERAFLRVSASRLEKAEAEEFSTAMTVMVWRRLISSATLDCERRELKRPNSGYCERSSVMLCAEAQDTRQSTAKEAANMVLDAIDRSSGGEELLGWREGERGGGAIYMYGYIWRFVRYMPIQSSDRIWMQARTHFVCCL